MHYKVSLPSRRTTKAFTTSFFSAFGVLAAINGVLNTVYADTLKTQGWPYLLLIFVLALGYAIAKDWPRQKASASFRTPPGVVRVEVGDLFAREGDIAIGMSDTFDTETPEIIQRKSVQGQLLERDYQNNRERLDHELEVALSNVSPLRTESRDSKRLGKLVRYPLGTVATLGTPGARRYCVAYSYMSNEPRSQSSADNLWRSLSSLWNAARTHGQMSSLSLPIVGSGLARLGNQLSHTDLIQMILLSYITASREGPIAQELVVVVSPSDVKHVDFSTIKQLLDSAMQ